MEKAGTNSGKVKVSKLNTGGPIYMELLKQYIDPDLLRKADHNDKMIFKNIFKNSLEMHDFHDEIYFRSQVDDIRYMLEERHAVADYGICVEIVDDEDGCYLICCGGGGKTFFVNTHRFGEEVIIEMEEDEEFSIESPLTIARRVYKDDAFNSSFCKYIMFIITDSDGNKINCTFNVLLDLDSQGSCVPVTHKIP